MVKISSIIFAQQLKSLQLSGIKAVASIFKKVETKVIVVVFILFGPWWQKDLLEEEET